MILSYITVLICTCLNLGMIGQKNVDKSKVREFVQPPFLDFKSRINQYVTFYPPFLVTTYFNLLDLLPKSTIMD